MNIKYINECKCAKCGAEVVNLDYKSYVCGCGSKVVIYGDNYKKTEEGSISCVCKGEKGLKMVFHLNHSDYYKYTYACCSCGNSITYDSIK